MKYEPHLVNQPVNDLAGAYKMLKPGPERSTPEIVADYDKLMRDGYVIIESLIGENELDAIRSVAPELLGHNGRNSFEGHKTQRVYDVLSKTTSIDRLADHPRILGLLDRIFLPGFLLSQAQIINIQHGEKAQMLHYDDAFYRIPRPRPPLGAATVFAIDDFTEKNGATVIIPGSHVWADEGPSPEKAIPAVMPAGSVIFFLGTTWHGGGANSSDASRLAVTCQYCEAYLRQQENFLLEITKDRAREMSAELRAMIGYSVYPPFMGMVDGKHPIRLLKP